MQARDAALVLLGNSKALSRAFDLGRDADVTRSPFARQARQALRRVFAVDAFDGSDTKVAAMYFCLS